MLTVTYQRVPLDVLAVAVHESEARIHDFVRAQDGWKIEGDLVTLPVTEYNQARQVKTTEHLDRKKVANIFSVLSK